MNERGRPLARRWKSAGAVVGTYILAVSALQAATPPLPMRDGVPTLAPLLQKVTPAVVNISVETIAPQRHNPLLRDPFFRRFFNLPDDAPPRPRQSAGSGVIVDADRGFVLSNHHVIVRADSVMVTLKDNRRFEAEVLGSDAGTDIALLRIEAGGLTALQTGDSDALEVGDFVIAIGNPFGLGQTVTSGIVSALGRSGINVEGYEDFIQTDASINPGNSGGALVNLHGELVGINTAIIGPSGGNVGIGFAVPVNIATAVMQQLAEHGEMQRGKIGVMIQDLTPDLAEALDLDIERGALVSRVQERSPAEQAGLQAGDVIVAVGGTKVESSRDLRNSIGLVRVGEEIEIDVQREQHRIRLDVRVGGEDSGEHLGAVDAPPALQGAMLRDLEQGDPAYGRIDGVIAAEVEPGSPAARNGIRPGDVIVAVNRRRVRNTRELESAFEQAGQVLALNIVRGNGQLFIVIR
ncbi:MAG: Do family serine endopeptidase [Gammaproteobacteria bacterium]|nr:Do family serine endopeptidase [Gammaproteobacteria bacterium]